MRSLLSASLLALAGLACTTATVRADVFIRVPFVTIRVGRPLPVVPASAPVYQPPTAPADFGAPPPVPGEPPPVPVPAATPTVASPAAVTVARAPTLREFAASFQPLPGTYKVVLQHPVTCQPVEVCFTLPPGCPRKVRVRPRELDFVYPRHTVSLRFVHNGTVRVRN